LILPADDKRRLVLVATSVGVAPFLPMLQSLEAGEYQRFDSVHLLFGVRDPTEVLFQETLLRLRSKASWFELTVHCSRSQDSAADWQYSGYVTNGLTQLALDPKSDHVLVCGNPKMVDDVYAALRVRQFGPRSVIREKYVFAVQEKSLQGPSRSSADEALLQQKMKAYGVTLATDPKPLKPV
jgi:NAD(P)H-flavin reductase